MTNPSKGILKQKYHNILFVHLYFLNGPIILEWGKMHGGMVTVLWNNHKVIGQPETDTDIGRSFLYISLNLVSEQIL